MGTMVLRPQDCLQNPLPADAFRPPPLPRPRRHRPRQTMLPARTVASPGHRAAPLSPGKPLPRRNNCSGCAGPMRPRRRCRTPEHHLRKAVKRSGKELVMEEVTLLRRGDAAAEDRRPVVPEESAGDLELCSTKRLGPDPAKLPKRIRLMDQKLHLYAGSGFFTSPPPSSLPLPTSFLAKKDAADSADQATIALRCLLRLDLP
ncbi:hypothetical protein Taro_024520 [Colocasia esculenta]|uniref:Uncharacterized protein n=1 Tax=Colocasia esculenta TaxID=4460 RepID=A0A843VEQ5_COLES|nr:hypothetical protein [Colocasia esculenta]